MTARLGRRLLVALATLAALMVAAGPASARTAAHPASHRAAPQHIFFIMMENHGFTRDHREYRGRALHQPARAAHNGVADNYFGVTHPSLPNYLAAVSGSFQGIWDDCQAGADAPPCPPEEFIPNSGDGTAGNYLTKRQIASASARPHLFGGRNLVDQLAVSRADLAGVHAVASRALARRCNTRRRSRRERARDLHAVRAEAQPVRVLLRHQPPGQRRGCTTSSASTASRPIWAPGRFRTSCGSAPTSATTCTAWTPTSAALGTRPSADTRTPGLDHGAIQLGDAFLQKTRGRDHELAGVEDDPLVDRDRLGRGRLHRVRGHLDEPTRRPRHHPRRLPGPDAGDQLWGTGHRVDELPPTTTTCWPRSSACGIWAALRTAAGSRARSS